MTEVQGHTELEHLPLTAPVFETEGLPEKPSVSEDVLRQRAQELTATWRPLRRDAKAPDELGLRLEKITARLSEVLRRCEAVVDLRQLTPPLELLESSRMLRGVLMEAESGKKNTRELPRVALPGDVALPRVMRVAETYLDAAGGIWSPESLVVFVSAVQSDEAMRLREIIALSFFLRLAEVEFILDRAEEAFAGEMPSIEESPFSAALHSLRRLQQYEWSKLTPELVAFYPVLARDPNGIFPAMDEETRSGYLERVATLAARSDCNEVQVAHIAVDLARQAEINPPADPRLARRIAHVGYYLFEEGFPELEHRIGYHPTAGDRARSVLAAHREDAYILSIFIVSVVSIAAFIIPLVPHHAFLPLMGTLLLALLPATQGASDLVNNSVTAFLRPRALPKLDFTKGIPVEAATLVCVPTLLLSEEQVIDLFDELEARYLSNTDPNLHFGLLTDLPDSDTRPRTEDRNELVDLAVRMTDQLNARYGKENGGSFLLLHRHRVFNARQGVWMGWERKRGKLLDLNKYLRGEFDGFPVKAGPVNVLKQVRYIITLDSDTQLPRNTAARMIGTMAHPLNQAIIDPRRRIVTKGYGILQPRVGVSVSSASRSRLAALYSGETGFDIYTRAVSDVYQDLFGEGIFTGKGIYEVSVLHQVLDRRFPRNTLLSHDLIEGAYVRAGLVTDIEVIDDYPSHYSAHTRRKHRWVRGDWQILRWLSSRVPDESGKTVENPISMISQWKIFDNLRRSLVEPITFILLVCGWLFLPGGARYWTFVTLTLLLFPVFVQLAFNLGRALARRSGEAVLESFRGFWSSLGFHLLNLAFLPHHALLSIDAIVRSLVRSLMTGRKLLEWETAAQAEATRTRSSLDQYLQASPILAIAIGIIIVLHHWPDLFAAGPILLLWALTSAITGWLNSPPRKLDAPLATDERSFLERQALLTWRYYAEFGDERNQWLIPDNVTEANLHQTLTLSPTNLGMLLNARQAALQLGFVTLPEFTRATLGTLATYDKLEKVNGHIYNWIDIPTLRPIPPFTISSVDSGNLAASFYALNGGALDTLKQPLLAQTKFSAIRKMMGHEGFAASRSVAALRESIQWLMDMPPIEAQNEWVLQEAERRRQHLLAYVERYLPWLLPRFGSLFHLTVFADPENEVVPTLQNAVDYVHALDERLAHLANAATGPERELAIELRVLLPGTMESLGALVHEVQHIANLSSWHANAMRFDFMLEPQRQLLSIGYDGAGKELFPACYDLVASEARIATFLAIAKGDIPQQAWFRLGRTHVIVNGRAALLSWTGTMFEYLMPALWMRHYPDTLITRSMESAIAVQQQHVKGMPWGISESGMATRDPDGRYQYQAWGIPALALKYGAEDGPVISPYSTFLTLPFIRQDAIANLRLMAQMGWIGDYGFYEAADYRQAGEPELVRSWMAHHQGMCLLAVTNLLCDNVFQQWFHSNAKVRAAELLLHERPLSKPALRELERLQPQLPSVPAKVTA